MVSKVDKVAVIGRIRSGKDTVARVFVEELGYTEFKLSSGITRVLQLIFPEKMMDGKPRKLYQSVGQSMREIDPDVWIDYCLKEIQCHQFFNDEDDKVIISDLRQKNEYIRLKKEGFIIIKVEADEDVRIDRMFKAGDNVPKESLLLSVVMNHEAERFSDEVVADYTIENNGSLDELYEKINDVIGKINRG